VPIASKERENLRHTTSSDRPQCPANVKFYNLLLYRVVLKVQGLATKNL